MSCEGNPIKPTPSMCENLGEQDRGVCSAADERDLVGLNNTPVAVFSAVLKRAT